MQDINFIIPFSGKPIFENPLINNILPAKVHTNAAIKNR